MAASNFATFGTASFAKKKGYDPPINSSDLYWDISGIHIHPDKFYVSSELAQVIFAPTQAQLQTWVREKHNIHIIIKYFNNSSLTSRWGWMLIKLDGSDIKETGIKEFKDYIFFDSYEDALEEGLRQALNRL